MSFRSSTACCKNLHIRRPLRGHDAMLGQMTAQRVDQLRALADQKIAGPEQHGARLLFLGLDRDEAHGRSARRLGDRLRVGRVVLLALDEGFDVDGRDQPNLMAEVADGAPPVMRAPAGLHGDDAARLLGQEGENFLARKLLAERHAAVGAGAMRLKGPLCKVETDDANLFHGCPLRSWDAQTSPPWHIAMPSGGGIHSINRPHGKTHGSALLRGLKIRKVELSYYPIGSFGGNDPRDTSGFLKPRDVFHIGQLRACVLRHRP